jgi:hypothetical protein
MGDQLRNLTMSMHFDIKIGVIRDYRLICQFKIQNFEIQKNSKNLEFFFEKI